MILLQIVMVSPGTHLVIIMSPSPELKVNLRGKSIASLTVGPGHFFNRSVGRALATAEWEVAGSISGA